MSKLKGLDLFCGAGGASVGYHRAGFEMTGVDLYPQKNYPFTFVQADALEYLAEHGHEFDAIHASPPCQAYSVTQNIHGREYPELVEPTRAALDACDLPYVIENVIGAPLHTTIELCGAMFGLSVYRHRRFESNVMLFQPHHPKHIAICTQVGRRPKPGEFMTVAGHFADIRTARQAMGIDWMTRDELAQAIPPAYTEFIGHQLMAVIDRRREEQAA
jgi:DNA (cytosine-5)-methyltransferase 1